MGDPRGTSTSRTSSRKAGNPGGHNENVRVPGGTDSSRTRRSTTSNPGGRNGTQPPASNGTGRTSTRTGSQPNPVHVQSGPKITRISPP